jgi:hypothetical protein
LLRTNVGWEKEKKLFAANVLLQMLSSFYLFHSTHEDRTKSKRYMNEGGEINGNDFSVGNATGFGSVIM